MNKVFQVKRPILKIILTILYVLYALVLYYFEIGCPYRFFFGVKCMGCGLTTAYIFAFKFDFISAFQSHFMFLTIPIIYCYIWFDGKLTGKKLIDYIILICILLGFIVRWILYFSIDLPKK